MNKIVKIVFFIILTFLICFSAHSVFANSTEIKVKSEFNQVCVYLDSALINRVTHLEFDKGNYKIIFSDIIHEVDDNSIRVSAEGTAAIKLFGAQIKKEFLTEIPSERINKLKQEIRELGDKIKEVQNFKSRLAEKKEILRFHNSIFRGQISQDLVTKMPSINDLKSILEFLDIQLKDYYTQILNCEINIRDLNDKIDALKRGLSQISGIQKKLKRSIVVELEVLKSGTADLHISYLVNGAAWKPIYGARANFDKSEVELVSYGVIKQITGEDWLNVDCSLSTAKPKIGGRIPYISPWTLKPC